MPIRKLCVVLLVLLFAGFGSRASAQTAVTPEIRVNVQTAGEQELPQVAMNAQGEFVVLWISRDSDADEFSLYARRFAADGTPATGEIPVREDAGYSVDAAVAMMEDGSFVVVYAAASDAGPGTGTFTFEGQRFTADGAPLGEPFAIGTGHAAADLSVAAQPDGGFVVAWEAYRQTIPEISVRIFDADGSPVRNEISLAQGNDPALAVGPDGEIVVVWMAAEPGGRRRYFVALQRLSPSGALQGRRSRVSNNSPDFLDSIRVAKDETGGFTVIWAGVFNRVYRGTLARRYFPNGAPATRIERLDAAGFETEIAAEPNGDFVLVWAQRAGPTIGTEVYGRRYRSHLHRTRRVFRVNTTRRGNQEEVAVTSNAAGNLVVVWQGENLDGSGSDVFARLYRR